VDHLPSNLVGIGTQDADPGSFGRDGKGYLVLVSVQTTNVPEHVVVNLWTYRKGIYGVYDRFREFLAKMQGKRQNLPLDLILLTNQTTVIPSTP